jgi:hypothetical protein
MDHLALVTNLFNACPYFHADCSSRGPDPVKATPKLAAWPPEGGRYKINLVLGDKFQVFSQTVSVFLSETFN